MRAHEWFLSHVLVTLSEVDVSCYESRYDTSFVPDIAGTSAPCRITIVSNVYNSNSRYKSSETRRSLTVNMCRMAYIPSVPI
jgi:hypothetical protein